MFLLRDLDYIFLSTAKIYGYILASLTHERTTGEILWEHFRGAQQVSESFSEGEIFHTTSYEELDVRVVDTVEPPYNEDN